jgi:CRP-like cAMP-binding protein
MLSIIEKLLALERVEIFSTLTLEQLSQIAEQTPEVSFKTGDLLFREGEPVDCVYFILRGKVNVKRQGAEAVIFGENSPPVGGWAMFTDLESDFTAEAEENCLTLRLFRDDFLSVMHTYHEIPINLLKMTARILMNRGVSLAYVADDPLLTQMGLRPAREHPAAAPGGNKPTEGRASGKEDEP